VNFTTAKSKQSLIYLEALFKPECTNSSAVSPTAGILVEHSIEEKL